MTVINVENPPLYSGGDFLPPVDDAYDLGSLTQAWQDVYADGAVYTDLISEFGAGVGVTVDGVLLKDSGFSVYADSYLIRAGANTTPDVLHFQKSRGTVAAPSVLTTGDILGDISFDGYVNGHFVQAGLMRVASAGTIGTVTDRMPAVWELWLNTDASPSVLTKRISVDQNGLITLPTATAAASGLKIGTNVLWEYAVGPTLVYQGLWIKAQNGFNAVDDVTIDALNGDVILRPSSSEKFRVATAVTTVKNELAITGGVTNGQSTNIKHITNTKTTNSGTNTETVSISIPLGASDVIVTIFVQTILAGALLTTFEVGFANAGTTADDLNAWGNTVAIAAGTATDVRDFTVAPGTLVFTNTTFDLVFTANAGVFSSGVIRYTISYKDATAATS